MDTAPEFLSLIDQLETDHHWLTAVSCGPKASQLDNFCVEERLKGKDIPKTRPNILRNGNREAERNVDNQGDKNKLGPERLQVSERKHLQSEPQSIQTIRETLSTALNSVVTIRTSLKAEMQAVNQGRSRFDIIRNDQRVFYAPYYHGEICAILDILPFLKEVMKQVTIHVKYLEKNESKERKQAMRIIEDLAQLKVTPPKKKNGMRRQDRMWRDKTNQDATPSPRPQQNFRPQQNQMISNTCLPSLAAVLHHLHLHSIICG